MSDITPEIIEQAKKALEIYIQRQVDKGLSVEMVEPPYHQGGSVVRCILVINGVRTRPFFREKRGVWEKS
jgi:hypothetical protein